MGTKELVVWCGGFCDKKIWTILKVQKINLLKMINKPATDTRDEIKMLALSNAVLYSCLVEYHLGRISYEQALELAIIMLAEQNEALLNRIKEIHDAGTVFLTNFEDFENSEN